MKWNEPLFLKIGQRKKLEEHEKEDQLKIKAHAEIPEKIRREKLDFPGASELEVARHYTRLSRNNFSIEQGMYPLGSCTMKYNPKISENIAKWDKIMDIHPLQPESTTQGMLEIAWDLEKMLCEISGMDAVTLHPAAGAQGEFLGLMVARAYFEKKGQRRSQVCIPDSAHGTNPASAAMAGYEVIDIPSKNGRVDLEALEKAITEDTAVLMMTNPNTLGLFETDIEEISRITHSKGALLYYDGANLNGIMGWARPGDMGFDIVHLNLHKTFASPHGGGGPGSGPVGVKKELAKFLPGPRIIKKEGGRFGYDYNCPGSVGKIHPFYGNWGVLLRAYCYILLMGNDLKKVSERAVLNANYLKKKVLEKGYYEEPYPGVCKHEFVLSCSKLEKEKGIRASDVSKRILDWNAHPPTVYFPLIVKECLMIEPTESEPKRELDNYANLLNRIAEEKEEIVKNAPHQTPVGRVDEVLAARYPKLTWNDLDRTDFEDEAQG